MSINMSYCMFENTVSALRECIESTNDSCDPFSELSESERKFAKKLVKMCRDFADDFESEITIVEKSFALVEDIRKTLDDAKVGPV